MTTRTLVIGDIHGCLVSLNTLLDIVRPGPQDRVITLGDYIDRGPDSRGVVDRLLALDDKTDWVPLRGNHEEMLCAARDGGRDLHFWLRVGGDETAASYNVALDPFDVEQSGAPLVDGVPDAHWRFFFERCSDAFETDAIIYCHAGVEPEKALSDHSRTELLWPKFIDRGPHCSNKRIVCGHTPQKSGRPLDVGHSVVVDTWVYDLLGWLTCLDVETGAYWQANDRGESREGQLASSVTHRNKCG